MFLDILSPDASSKGISCKIMFTLISFWQERLNGATFFSEAVFKHLFSSMISALSSVCSCCHVTLQYAGKRTGVLRHWWRICLLTV